VPTVEERMRGPEVLDITQHVEIRFWSFEVLVEDADPAAGRWRLRLRGGLELKGERHTVEIPVEVRRRGADFVATGEAKLRLRDLGVEPPSVAGVVKVSNDFRVTFEVRARRTDQRFLKTQPTPPVSHDPRVGQDPRHPESLGVR
jgi:polyisoprenoid-binding protein YceI